MPDLAEQIAATLDPKAWTDEERGTGSAQKQNRYRRTHSLKRARTVLLIIAGHFAELGKMVDGSAGGVDA